MGHSFDILTFDFLLKPTQPITGLFLSNLDDLHVTSKFTYICLNLLLSSQFCFDEPDLQSNYLTYYT